MLVDRKLSSTLVALIAVLRGMKISAETFDSAIERGLWRWSGRGFQLRVGNRLLDQIVPHFRFAGTATSIFLGQGRLSCAMCATNLSISAIWARGLHLFSSPIVDCVAPL